jgi:hypothetical protein
MRYHVGMPSQEGSSRRRAAGVRPIEGQVADVHSDRLRDMAYCLDEVKGCLKVAIGWRSLSEGGRRELLLRALDEADRAIERLVYLDEVIDLTEADPAS